MKPSKDYQFIVYLQQRLSPFLFGQLLFAKRYKFMKYSAKHLRYKGDHWECTLERWEGCQCNSQATPVRIYQEKRPTLADIKANASW